MGISLGDQQSDCLFKMRFARRRTTFLNIAELVEKDDVAIQKKHRKSGTEDLPGQNEDSEQPKVEQANGGNGRRHQGRDHL